MTWLADDDVHVWIGIPGGAVVNLERCRRPIPDRDRAARFALVVDDVEQQAIDGDRIGAEHDLFRIEDVFCRPRERTAVPHAAQAVHDLEHRPGTERLDRGERAHD